jgi:hypothetical protein
MSNTILFPASKKYKTDSLPSGNPDHRELILDNMRTSIFIVSRVTIDNPDYERIMARARKELEHYHNVLEHWRNQDKTKTHKFGIVTWE